MRQLLRCNQYILVLLFLASPLWAAEIEKGNEKVSQSIVEAQLREVGLKLNLAQADLNYGNLLADHGRLRIAILEGEKKELEAQLQAIKESTRGNK